MSNYTVSTPLRDRSPFLRYAAKECCFCCSGRKKTSNMHLASEIWEYSKPLGKSGRTDIRFAEGLNYGYAWITGVVPLFRFSPNSRRLAA